MKYKNAKDVLPDKLLKEVQKYIVGGLLYIPTEDGIRSWGEASGYREKLKKRNQMICNKYQNGSTISELASEYYLSIDSVKKIVYSNRKETNLMYQPSLESALSYTNDGMLEEWVHSHLMFTLKEESFYERINLQEHTYFGIVKLPLRLVEFDRPDMLSDNDKNIDFEINAPIIMEYVDGRFHSREEPERIMKLKNKKINAYPSVVMINAKENNKYFMSNFGRHFLFVSSLKS